MTDDTSGDLARLASRVDRLVTERRLLQVCRDVAFGMDKRDEQRFFSAFHPDGVFDCGPAFGTYAGYDRMGEFLREHVWTDMPITHHYVVNLVVKIDGDTAEGICDQDILLGAASGQLVLVSSPQYDKYERRDGEWRLTYRAVWPAHTARVNADISLGPGTRLVSY